MMFIKIGMDLVNHGKVVKKNIIIGILSLILDLGILYWGGFFNQIGFVQIILIIILSVGLGKNIGEGKTEDIVDVRGTIFAIIVLTILLFLGNFF